MRYTAVSPLVSSILEEERDNEGIGEGGKRGEGIGEGGKRGEGGVR